MKYIALLRGVNVGGKNKLSMQALKEDLIQHGFSQVETYINSGNILFSSDEKDETVLQSQIEMLIKNKYHIDTTVAIISSDDLIEALAHAPIWWNKDKESKHNAIFVIPPLTAEEIFVQIGDIKPEYERVDFYGKVIFWSAPLKTFSKTRWSKVVASKTYSNITIRNANTIMKLLFLIQST